MGLDLNSEANNYDYLPIIKYDARAGRMYRVDREFADGRWTKYNTELDRPAFAMDLANIETGWISFDPPDFQMAPVGSPRRMRPSEKHKQGFRVRVYNKELAFREFSNTAKCVISAVSKLHDQFEKEFQPADKLPVVQMVGTELRETKTPQGTTRNYEPVFAITGWIDRPDDWPFREKTENPSPPSPGLGPNNVRIPAYHFPGAAGPATAGVGENLF